MIYLNKELTKEKRKAAGRRVQLMERKYKETLQRKFGKRCDYIGNQQYIIIPNFITKAERDDMHK